MRSLYLLFISLLFISCNLSNRSTLQAKFEKVEEGTPIFIGEPQEGHQIKIIDTATVKNGKIAVDLPEVETEKLSVLTIGKPKGKEKIYFINNNRPVKLTVYSDSLLSSRIVGGGKNTLLQEYRAKINEGERELRKMKENYTAEELRTARAKNQLKIKRVELDNRNTAYRRAFLEQQTESLVSLLVYADLIQTQTVSVNEMRRIYNSLSPELRETGFGKQLGIDYTNTDPLAIGNIAPSFSAPTPEGNELALEDTLDKYTLVDFWAAWCRPCRIENPNLVRVYNKYHDKGFNILGVSLDRNKRSWIRAIEQDGLVWDQISNLNSWNDPIAKQYKIRSIPASILLDGEGRIIAKNLRGIRLERKIEELLGE
ncbi:MAG TPA: TlpA disulfide reductase family protein [Flavobacteriaceae bacterium]|nr:TlpA disulfide reductase family protein [Flavobacteriaceae bacterium]